MPGFSGDHCAITRRLRWHAFTVNSPSRLGTPSTVRHNGAISSETSSTDPDTDASSQAGPAARLIDVVRSARDKFDADDMQVVLHHLARETDTLETLGQARGVTRERIRQREARVVAFLNAHGDPDATALAQQLLAELPPITTAEVVDQRTQGLFRLAAATQGDDFDDAAAEISRYLVKSRLGLTTKGPLTLTAAGRAILTSLAEYIKAQADDVGLVNYGLVAERFPEAMPMLDEVLDCLGVARVGKHPALRDTVRARLKLALLQIGRPATQEEISEQAGHPGGRPASTLSNIDSVARADRHRWGLIDWIDGVYEGIPTEIGKSIDAHGGAVPLSFLTEDLARRFDVSKDSVTAYARTRQFQVTDGIVRHGNPDSITYRPVDDVAGRNERGELVWGFKVNDGYLRGYSIIGLPPELARVLGCGPNGRTEVEVASPQGSDPVSVIWRLSNIAGTAEVGRVRFAMKKIGAVHGDNARLVIQEGGDAVRFELVSEPTASASPTADDGADAATEGER